MFNFGDNVDRDTVDIVEQARGSRPSTKRRQISDFVVSVYRALVNTAWDQNKTRSSAVAERPRDASCCWVFWLVAEGCSK